MLASHSELPSASVPISFLDIHHIGDDLSHHGIAFLKCSHKPDSRRAPRCGHWSRRDTIVPWSAEAAPSTPQLAPVAVLWSLEGFLVGVPHQCSLNAIPAAGRDTGTGKGREPSPLMYRTRFTEVRRSKIWPCSGTPYAVAGQVLRFFSNPRSRVVIAWWRTSPRRVDVA